MSLGDVTVSAVARRRIRSFSATAWIAGALVMAGVGYNTYVAVGFGENGFALMGDARNPWQQENPTVFEPQGDDEWAGEGSGVIRIPQAEHGQDPYTVSLTQGEYVDVFVTRVEDLSAPADERWPDNIGYLDEVGDEVLILPGDGDLELWVRTDQAWEFTLAQTPVDEITDVSSGKGDAFLVYRGDAVSARLIHKGDGIFFVTVQPVGGESDQPVIETGEVDQRTSWNPTTAVYFSIESDEERGAWTVDIDELATDAPTSDTDTGTETDPTDAPAPDGTPPAFSDPTPAALPAVPASRSTASRPTRGTPSV
ncbi:hypothetical protein IWX78_001512 [Mycetocola sp. CAN_C7]|uniref:hypothetical protein n=1 Tax=Mycetocola sp. CAN_C7 TaxID=2787724 RepID=UPI0018CA876F